VRIQQLEDCQQGCDGMSAAEIDKMLLESLEGVS